MNVSGEWSAQQGGGFGQPPGGGFGQPPGGGGGGGFGQPPGGGGFGQPPGGGGFGPPPGGQPPGGFGAPPPGGGGGFGPPPVGPAPDAGERVKLPAIALIVYAGIGAAWSLFNLVMSATGASLSGLAGQDQIPGMFSGAIGIVSAVIQLGVCGLIVFGALQMKSLQKWPIAVAAAVVAAIPCVTPCCCLGTPVGIWAAIIAFKPEIKSAFRG